MSKHLMVPANRDPNVLIRDDSTHLIHVRLTKTDYNPKDPAIQSKYSKIVPYRIEEFEKLEQLKNQKISIDWVKAAGFTSCFVCHDGRLEKVKEVPKAEVPAADSITLTPEQLDALVADKVKEVKSKEATKRRRVDAMKKNFEPAK